MPQRKRHLAFVSLLVVILIGYAVYRYIWMAPPCEGGLGTDEPRC